MDPLGIVVLSLLQFLFMGSTALSRLARAMQAPLLLRFFQLLGVCRSLGIHFKQDLLPGKLTCRLKING